MFGINAEQYKGVVRWGCGVAGAWLIGHGYGGGLSVSDFVAAAPVVGALVWSIASKTQSAAIAVVSKMPEVSAVVTTPDIAHNSTFFFDDKVVTEFRKPVIR